MTSVLWRLLSTVGIASVLWALFSTPEIYVPELQFGIWVNVASGEFRGSSYDNSFLSGKTFWVHLRRENFSFCSKMFDMHCSKTINV